MTPSIAISDSTPISAHLKHLALIMDGNGRWAEQRGLSRSEGHRQGAEVVKTIVRSVRRKEIPFLTLFALSTLNWGRPTEEINALLDLLHHFLNDQEQEMIDQGIQLKGIGDRSFLPFYLQQLLAKVEKSTAKGQKMILTLAVSYDGRRDVVQAAQKLVSLAQKGTLVAADVGEELFMNHLSTAHQPEVDLLIRTSGERRLSGFLPLEACYAELIFIQKLWPDFTTEDLNQALVEYEQRQRRFGLTRQQIETMDIQSSPA